MRSLTVRPVVPAAHSATVRSKISASLFFSSTCFRREAGRPLASSAFSSATSAVSVSISVISDLILMSPLATFVLAAWLLAYRILEIAPGQRIANDFFAHQAADDAVMTARHLFP
ncbi:hypothetical protein FHR88_002132 [Bradyrhizobium betae]|nr:hypothetical protein [Bradyrhizobium betae]